MGRGTYFPWALFGGVLGGLIAVLLVALIPIENVFVGQIMGGGGVLSGYSVGAFTYFGTHEY